MEGSWEHPITNPRSITSAHSTHTIYRDFWFLLDTEGRIWLTPHGHPLANLNKALPERFLGRIEGSASVEQLPVVILPLKISDYV